MFDNKVSIVMPVYNAEKYLYYTIRSIINQTHKYWELIAVDDNSSDSSRQILESFAEKDDRIKPIFLHKNGGVAIARNEGIRKATGHFLAFIDSDDLWYPKKLEMQLVFMQKNNYTFTFTGYDLISDSGKRLNKIVEVPQKISYQVALRKTVISTITVMIDLNKIYKFEMPDLRAAQDTATWLMLLKKTPYAYGLNEILSSYRQVPGSISNNFKRRMTRMWHVYRDVEKLSLISSFKNYTFYACYVLRKRKRLNKKSYTKFYDL